MAAQWDYNNDGGWDTGMSFDEYRIQQRVYVKPGQHVITGRVRLSDGGETKPCRAGFTLQP